MDLVLLSSSVLTSSDLLMVSPAFFSERFHNSSFFVILEDLELGSVISGISSRGLLLNEIEVFGNLSGPKRLWQIGLRQKNA